MRLFEFHIDRELGRLGGGTLPPRRWRRAVRHARNCHRCAALYERSVRVLRQLENQSPFEPAQAELEAIAAFNAPVVLRPSQLPGRGWALGFFGLAVVSALVLMVSRVTTPTDEFAVRGGAGTTPVALRIFCGGSGAALNELREGAACVAGKSLAFAVGAPPTHSQAVVQIRGSATSEARAVVAVSAAVGAEEPVALTAHLDREGEVEVVVAFAADEATATAAVAGQRAPGAVVLRRLIRVVP